MPDPNWKIGLFVLHLTAVSLRPLLWLLGCLNSPPLQYLLRKGRQQSVADQAAIRPSASPCIQAEKDNPAGGVGSQEPVKALGTALFPLPRVPQIEQAT